MKARRDRADDLGLVGAVLLVLITECVLGVVVLAMKVHGDEGVGVPIGAGWKEK
jgi:hypothetical protein